MSHMCVYVYIHTHTHTSPYLTRLMPHDVLLYYTELILSLSQTSGSQIWLIKQITCLGRKS